MWNWNEFFQMSAPGALVLLAFAGAVVVLALGSMVIVSTGRWRRRQQDLEETKARIVQSRDVTSLGE